jgi:hypothetical protein
MKKIIAQVTTISRPATDQPFGGLKFTLIGPGGTRSQIVQETSVAFDDPAVGVYVLTVQAINEDGTPRSPLLEINVEVGDITPPPPPPGTWPEPIGLSAEVFDV